MKKLTLAIILTIFVCAIGISGDVFAACTSTGGCGDTCGTTACSNNQRCQECDDGSGTMTYVCSSDSSCSTSNACTSLGYNCKSSCGQYEVVNDYYRSACGENKCCMPLSSCILGGESCTQHKQCCSHYPHYHKDIGYGDACQNGKCCVYMDMSSEICTTDSECCWSGVGVYCSKLTGETTGHCCESWQKWDGTKCIDSGTGGAYCSGTNKHQNDCNLCNSDPNKYTWCNICCSLTSSGGAICGNGQCETGETAASCPADCGGGGGGSCGNGVCDNNEDCTSCQQDCGQCPAVVAKTPLLQATGMATYTAKSCASIKNEGSNCADCCSAGACTADIVGKAAKCVNGQLVPVCGGSPTNFTATIDNCARWGPWAGLDERGYQEGDAIICTAASGTSCKDIPQDENPQSEEGCTYIKDRDGKEYCVVYCVDPCKDSPCEGYGGQTTTCVDKAYNPGDKIIKSQLVSGDYKAVLINIVYEQSTCIRTGSGAGDFRVRKVMKPPINTDFYRVNETVFCPSGCSAGKCLENKPPTLTSLTAKPVLAKLGDIINVTSVGSDPDFIVNKTTGKRNKEPVKLECSSTSSSGDISGGEEDCTLDPVTGDWICDTTTPTTPPTSTFDADLCKGNYSVSNPNCTITVSWTDSGDKQIYCRIRDKTGNYSTEKNVTVRIDNGKPTVDITSPDANSMQTKSFDVSVNDTDTNGMAYCNYSIWSNGNSTKNSTRTCNSKFTVTVGKNKDCGIGTCKVWVIGFDKAGNDKTDEREFIVSYVSSVITSPDQSSWQAKNFSVRATDTDFSGASIDRCEYSVRNSAGITLDWTSRTCNSAFTVAVGQNGDCNEQGMDKCWVYVRANNSEGAQGSESFRYFSIDWITPTSTIVPPTPDSLTWLKTDFDVHVSDEEYSGLGFEKCEYRVESKGTQTKPWTPRTCDDKFTVSVGKESTKMCRDEGIGTCMIFVRAKSKTGVVGREANQTFSILLSDVDIGLDAFNLTTESGVKFYGNLVPPYSIITPLFRVCSSGSSVEECKNSYTLFSSNCGINKPCICGAFNEYECEAACTDKIGMFYLLATDTSGMNSRNIVSLVKPFQCPYCNLDGLLQNLSIIRGWNITYTAMIDAFDRLMRESSDPAKQAEYNATMKRYREAKLVVLELIEYLDNVIKAPTTTKCQDAFARIAADAQKILQILGSGYVPTELEIDANVPYSVKFNTTVDIPINIIKTGSLPLYVNLTCKIVKPSSSRISSSSSCLDMTTTDTKIHNVVFNSTELGAWRIECSVFGSINSECKRGVRYDLFNRTFTVVPPLDPYVTDVQVPADVINGTNVDAMVTVYNPESYDIYANVKCTFRNPAGSGYNQASSCKRIYGQQSQDFTTSKTADKAGTWTVANCSVFLSTNEQCTSSSLRDVSYIIREFNVAVPDYVYISYVTGPSSDIIENTPARIRATVVNPLPDNEDRYVLVDFTAKDPDDNEITDTANCTYLPAGGSRYIYMDFTPNKIGKWNITNVSVSDSTDGYCGGAALSHSVSGPAFNVVKNMNLTILSVGPLTPVKINTTKVLDVIVKNPFTVDKFGYVTCILRKPSNIPLSNTSKCIKMTKNANTNLNINISVDRTGEWLIQSCSVYGSGNQQCSGAGLHNTMNNPGAFNVLSILEPFISYSGFSEPSIYVGQKIDVILNVTNPNTETAYLSAKCNFSTSGKSIVNYSACTDVASNSNETITVSLFPDLAGTWNVRCLLNTSGQDTCATGTETATTNVGTFSVTTPADIFILAVDAQSRVLNNTDTEIGVNIKNPKSVAVHSKSRCEIEKPNGATQELVTICRTLTPGETYKFNMSLHVDKVGAWKIKKCYAEGSLTLSDCSSVNEYDIFDSPKIIEVVVENNLTISSVGPLDIVIVNTTKMLDIVVSNPTTQDKEGKVTCKFRKPNSQIFTNTTTCEYISAGASKTLSLGAFASMAGAWAVTECTAYECSSPLPQHILKDIGTYNVIIPNFVYISSVTAPTTGIMNNTMATVRATINNPLSNNKFVHVTFTIRKPDGSEFTNTPDCIGMVAGSSLPVSHQFLVNKVGQWSVKNVSVSVSSSASCSGSSVSHSVSGPSFDVIASQNLSILYVDLPAEIRINTSQILSVDILNPTGTDSYGKVTCNLRKPNMQIVTNSSACELVPAGLTHTFRLFYYANIRGTWDIISCYVSGSMNSDCSASAIQHTITNAGSYNVTIEPPYAGPEPYLNNTRLLTNTTFVGGYVGITGNIINTNTMNGTNAIVQCTIKDPNNIMRYTSTPCLYVQQNSAKQFSLNFVPDKIGLWNATQCTLNASMEGDCAASSVRNRTQNIGTVTVTYPTHIYISSVSAPTDVINDSIVPVIVNVKNPSNDIYALVRCKIKNPNGIEQERITNCSGVERNTEKAFKIETYADTIGTWDVTFCSVDAGSSSLCSDASIYHNVTNPASFNVVRGSNLTILSVSLPPTTRINTTKTIGVIVRNPSTIDRFGRVTCSIRKPNTQIFTNTTACIGVPSSSTYNFNVNMYVDAQGTWDVLSCTVFGSLNSDCSSSTVHHTVSNSGSFDVVTQFNLTIRGTRLMYDTIFINNYISTIVDTRNPDIEDRYGIVTCDFKAPSNITYTNSSVCKFIEREHDDSFEVKYYANISGTWYIRNCTLNASAYSDCSSSKTHAKAEYAGLVYVRAPDLMITDVTPPQTSLNIGDSAEIKVNVKNFASTNRTAYVNCSIKDPANITHVVVSPTKTLLPSTTETFIASIRVGVPGTWTVLSCAVYKIMSPATKEHEISLNDIFSVLYPQIKECAIGSDCPGTNAKCYCSNNACQPCASDKKCQSNTCVAAVEPECITDNDCPPGHLCQNDACVRKGECTYDMHCAPGYRCESYNCARIGDCIISSDCATGFECKDYKCTKTEKSWFDQNIFMFIIILFVILLIPILLFSYARRSI